MVQVWVNKKQLMTPGKKPFEVPTQELADAIQAEWAGNPVDLKKKGYSAKFYTSLAATALDRARSDRESFLQHVISVCENDQFICWVDHPESLVKLQKEKWKPLIDKINAELGLQLQPHTELHIRELSEAEINHVREWLKELNDFQLAAFSYLCELSHSFLAPFFLIRGHLESPHVAWEIIELHENFQRSQWGEDTEDMERSRAMEEEFAQAHQFFLKAA